VCVGFGGGGGREGVGAKRFVGVEERAPKQFSGRPGRAGFCYSTEGRGAFFPRWWGIGTNLQGRGGGG